MAIGGSGLLSPALQKNKFFPKKRKKSYFLFFCKERAIYTFLFSTRGGINCIFIYFTLYFDNYILHFVKFHDFFLEIAYLAFFRRALKIQVYKLCFLHPLPRRVRYMEDLPRGFNRGLNDSPRDVLASMRRDATRGQTDSSSDIQQIWKRYYRGWH